MVTSKCS